MRYLVTLAPADPRRAAAGRLSLSVAAASGDLAAAKALRPGYVVRSVQPAPARPSRKRLARQSAKPEQEKRP